MSEKRFILLKPNVVFDNNETAFFLAENEKEAERIVALLNSLYDENEQLRQDSAHWKHRVYSLLWILGQFDKDKVKGLLKELEL